MDYNGWATIAGAIISAIATIIAVYFTNKWTSERYEKDKEYQFKKEKMVVIKPYLTFANFYQIIDELIVYNNKDRVLLLSSERDGFEFFDNKDKRGFDNHRLLIVKNECSNSIKSVFIDVQCKITTESQAMVSDKYTNFIQQLRSNEEFIFRIHNMEQRSKLWEELFHEKRVITYFQCKIYYLTEANEQIVYDYEIKIESVPTKKEENEKIIIYDNPKIEVLKDEYKLCSDYVKISQQASPFRNIQDYILTDRVSYLYEKIGEAQAKGLILQASKFNNGNFLSNNIVQQPIVEDLCSLDNK